MTKDKNDFIEEIEKVIEDRKHETQIETGSFKYDFVYEEIIEELTKFKE